MSKADKITAMLNMVASAEYLCIACDKKGNQESAAEWARISRDFLLNAQATIELEEQELDIEDFDIDME